VLFPDGTRLVRPDHRALAVAAGLQTEASRPFYDLVVVGAGPAGLGAGVYAASEGLRVAILENIATGGQAGTSSKIENYLGFPSGISGTDLARRAVAQARKFGAEILATAEATGVRVEDPVKVVCLADGSELTCRALLIATGMTIRRIEVADAERLLGAGVYYGAAPGEAVTYRGEHVLVIGGANSAGQAAMMLSRFAGRVTMVVRGSSLEAGMSQYLVDKIRSTSSIEVLLETQVVGVEGETHLQAVTLRNRADGSERTLPAEGMFIFIGAVPHSGFVRDLLACDPKGFILTGPDLRVEGRLPEAWKLPRDPFPLETSVPGIFAAGDVRYGVVRRVASAVGQGAVAVSMIHQYLETV
jgi:thioredoxin reductase (NADPH)